MKNVKARTASLATLGLAAALPTSQANAATSVGDIFSGWTSQTQFVGRFLVEAFFMGGIGLTGFGLWTLYQASKPQTQATYRQPSHNWASVAVCAACLPSPAFPLVASSTAGLATVRRRFSRPTSRGEH